MLGAMSIFAVIYYLVYGRRFYKGPVVEPEVEQFLDTVDVEEEEIKKVEVGIKF